MRARQPDLEGYLDRNGVKIAYEVHGSGQPTVLLAPTLPIVDSQHWKAQVPYLARHFRVVTFDPRGNGRSDRPSDPAAYADAEYIDDIIAVLDTVGAQQAVLVGLCTGGWWSLAAAALHPDRALGVAWAVQNARMAAEGVRMVLISERSAGSAGPSCDIAIPLRANMARAR